MKKLLLTSDGLSTEKIRKEFLKLVGKPAINIKVLYIPTAANVSENKSYVEIDKKNIFSVGISENNFIEFDLDNLGRNANFDEIDAIFIEGGNTYYLLKRVRETGFDKVLIKLLNRGAVYVGISAGSILAGPDISISQKENQFGLTDFTGLNLTNRAISPHFQKKERGIINSFEERTNHKALPLNDGQALLILGDVEEII